MSGDTQRIAIYVLQFDPIRTTWSSCTSLARIVQKAFKGIRRGSTCVFIEYNIVVPFIIPI